MAVLLGCYNNPFYRNVIYHTFLKLVSFPAPTVAVTVQIAVLELYHVQK